MLYSIGKDSAVMLHLARKAFFPARLPFPLLHVDTRFKFREMYAFEPAPALMRGSVRGVYCGHQLFEHRAQLRRNSIIQAHRQLIALLAGD